jgi:hypothetical protein
MNVFMCVMICCRCMLDMHLQGYIDFLSVEFFDFQVWVLCGFMQEVA